MKKQIIVIAAVLLSVCMTGCGPKDDTAETQNTATTAAVTEAETTTAEETAESTSEEAETTTAAEEKTTEAASDDEADNAELEKTAVDQMDRLTKLWGYMSGKIDREQDGETIRDEESGKEYAKVTESGLSSLADIEALINDTCSGKVKDDLINDMNNSFMEKDGTLYVFVTAHGFTIFPTQSGVKLSNVTEDSFTAVTNDSSALDGQGKAEFVKSGDKWLIDSCSFE